MLLNEMYDLQSSGIDELSLKFISEGLQTQTSDKFDYLKYAKAIKALSKMHMDKATAIQSTLTTASTMGVNKEEILHSAKKFLELVDNEEHKFNVALQRQSIQKVEDKKQEIQESITRMHETKRKIQELQETLQEEEKKQKELEEEMTKNQDVLTQRKNNFHLSIEQIKKLIQEDIHLLQI